MLLILEIYFGIIVKLSRGICQSIISLKRRIYIFFPKRIGFEQVYRNVNFNHNHKVRTYILKEPNKKYKLSIVYNHHKLVDIYDVSVSSLWFFIYFVLTSMYQTSHILQYDCFVECKCRFLYNESPYLYIRNSWILIWWFFCKSDYILYYVWSVVVSIVYFRYISHVLLVGIVHLLVFCPQCFCFMMCLSSVFNVI